jgi:hypothetical protein
MIRFPKELTFWGLGLLLMAPAAIPYLAHFANSKPHARPTGYIQPDMPIYMAKAREYFDSGAVQFTYSNPCNDSYAGARLYVQPWTFVLGLVHWLTGWPPRWLYPAFWFGAAWVCARAGLELYRELAGLSSPAAQRGLIVFFWGGGLLVVSGALLTVATTGHVAMRDLFALDPFQGWWFLNFGRNLVYPTEALYHALFFLCILNVVRRRWGWALACAALEAACTPFTGFELLAILTAWGMLEVVFLEDSEGVRSFFMGVVGLLVLYLMYYGAFLNAFPEHRGIVAQMSLDWGYSAETFVPAEILVGGLAAWRLRTLRRARAVLAAPRERLLLVWALVAFGLANHEFAVAPRQPIHFDRGYVWTALFFLGAPTLLELLDALRRRWGRIAVLAVLLVLLSDNLAWFAAFVPALHSGVPADVRVTRDQSALLDRLNSREFYGDLLLSDDRQVGYLAIAETPLRSWTSHWLETPEFRRREADLDALFARGRFLPAWERRRLLIVFTRGPEAVVPPPWLVGRGAQRAYENHRFVVYRIAPTMRP